MKKVLVTGAAGFIPSSLVDRLLEEGYRVVGIDNFLTGYRYNVVQHPHYTFIQGDANNYRELSAIMTTYAFDYVFHYAAVVGVKRTTDHPVLVLNDIAGIQHILELSKNTGVQRIFFSSSSEVYGEPVEIPQHEETTPLNSRLPYAVVKNVAESYLKAWQREYGLPYTILRFFNTYGPRQSRDFVISKFLYAARRNEDITIYGDGLQTRTFCYIDDNLDFTLRLLKDDMMINDVVNVGHDRQYTMLELADLIIQATQSTSAIVHLPPLAEGDMTRRQPDISKMRSILNRELIPLQQGIEKIVSATHHTTLLK